MKWAMLIVLAAAVLLIAGCQKSDSGSRAAGGNTFTAEDSFDDHGWKGQIAVTFDGDDIVTVDFEEVNKQGKKKSQDEGYTTQMKAVSGIGPGEAMQQLEAGLVAKDDPEAVDVVSGATATSKRFTDLARQAVGKRKS